MLLADAVVRCEMCVLLLAGIKLDEDDSPLMFTPRCLKRSVSTGSLTGVLLSFFKYTVSVILM